MSLNKLSNLYTILVSGFLLAEGCWGLFSPVVFGVLSTSIFQSVIYLILAIAGIIYSRRGAVRQFNIFAGICLSLIGLSWFMQGLGESVVGILNMNAMIAYLNITLGIVFLISGILLPKRTTQEENLVILF